MPVCLCVCTGDQGPRCHDRLPPRQRQRTERGRAEETTKKGIYTHTYKHTHTSTRTRKHTQANTHTHSHTYLCVPLAPAWVPLPQTITRPRRPTLPMPSMSPNIAYGRSTHQSVCLFVCVPMCVCFVCRSTRPNRIRSSQSRLLSCTATGMGQDIEGRYAARRGTR